MAIDTKELRRLAQAATPGHWQFWHGWVAADIDNDGGVIIVERPTPSGGKYQARVDNNFKFIAAANPAAVIETIEKLEDAEKDIALKEQLIDALGSELNAVANERDALRTVLTDLLNDLEDRAKWNLEESQRVVACGNGVYMRAKAALEESK